MGRPRPARPPVDRARGAGRPGRRPRTGILGDMRVGDGLREGVGGTIAAMKALGLDVGAYRLSLYSLFSTVIVAIFLYIAVRLILRATKWLLRRNTRIDQTQRLLTEKLIAIALFTLDRKSTRLNYSH